MSLYIFGKSLYKSILAYFFISNEDDFIGETIALLGSYSLLNFKGYQISFFLILVWAADKKKYLMSFLFYFHVKSVRP